MILPFLNINAVVIKQIFTLMIAYQTEYYKRLREIQPRLIKSERMMVT